MHIKGVLNWLTNYRPDGTYRTFIMPNNLWQGIQKDLYAHQFMAKAETISLQI